MDLVSVILPIYNMEKYLGECLDSIITQTYSNIEIICVIDGAQDNSKLIADKYAENDSRITVLWQENAGSGPARNNGLNHANGKYIVFIDPDDWISEDFIEKLIEAQADKYDFVMAGATSVVFENDVEVKRRSTIETPRIYDYPGFKSEYLKLYREGVIGSPTKKVYLKRIIDQYNIVFPDFRRSQDIVFNYRYFNHCENARVISYKGYYYRIEPKDRLLRLKEDYYETLNYIVRDVRKLYSSWASEVPEIEIANTYVYIYMANIESNVIANRDVSKMIHNDEVKYIFNTTNISRIDVLLTKIFISNHNEMLIKLLYKLRFFIKKIGKNW